MEKLASPVPPGEKIDLDIFDIKRIVSNILPENQAYRDVILKYVEKLKNTPKFDISSKAQGDDEGETFEDK